MLWFVSVVLSLCFMKFCIPGILLNAECRTRVQALTHGRILIWLVFLTLFSMITYPFFSSPRLKCRQIYNQPSKGIEGMCNFLLLLGTLLFRQSRINLCTALSSSTGVKMIIALLQREKEILSLHPDVLITIHVSLSTVNQDQNIIWYEICHRNKIPCQMRFISS